MPLELTEPTGPVRVSVRRVGDVEVPLPTYQTSGAVGLDLCAAIGSSVEILPGKRELISTGLAMAIPRGYEGQVRPRSGLAFKYGITVLNSPGTIDPDYRGELKVVLINLGADPFVVRPLDRIAQLVLCPVARAALALVLDLDATERGAGGYGSTGV